jgi:hypothetical protein
VVELNLDDIFAAYVAGNGGSAGVGEPALELTPQA